MRYSCLARLEKHDKQRREVTQHDSEHPQKRADDRDGRVVIWMARKQLLRREDGSNSAEDSNRQHEPRRQRATIVGVQPRPEQKPACSSHTTTAAMRIGA